MPEKEPIKLNQNIAGAIEMLTNEMHETKRYIKSICTCISILTALTILPLILSFFYLLSLK